MKLSLRIKKPLMALTAALLCPFAPNAHAVDGGGGMDSGGGGTLIPEHATVGQINSAMKILQPFVISYFETLEGYYVTHLDSDVSTPISKKLFNATKDPVRFIRDELVVELRQTTDCVDRTGKPTDASIVAAPPAQVCISAGRISQRLKEYEVINQLGALLVHEISHLFGTTEEEAIYLQKDAYRLFSEHLILYSSKMGDWYSPEELYFAGPSLRSQISREGSLQPAMLHETLEEIDNLIFRLFTPYAGRKHLASMRPSLARLVFNARVRAASLYEYVRCNNEYHSDTGYRRCMTDYQQIFGGKREAPTSELTTLQRKFIPPDHVNLNFQWAYSTVRVVKSLDDFNFDLDQLAKEIELYNDNQSLKNKSGFKVILN